MKLLLWSVISLSFSLCTIIHTPILEIEQGKVRGLRSVFGVYQYFGIPYAVARRFQPPQKPPKWQGTFNAVYRFRTCAQTVHTFALGVEDCLQLDVYTPETRAGQKLPVLMFLHGGGYYYGSKWHYDPEFLVKKNIIAVIINYRVGVLGFLCINDVSNLGLRDQVAALQWIKKNIAAFGGDPENVTISGQSAGASAAGLHFLSDYSKGLFHKAILMSGTPLNPWSLNAEPSRPAFEDARKLGKVNNEKDVYDIFSNASLSDLLSSTSDVSVNSRYFKYSPCLDANLTHPFFRDAPYNIIKSGHFTKVPIMMGSTNSEGMLFYGINTPQSLKELNDNFIERLPSIFSWCSHRYRSMIAKKIQLHYFNNKIINKSTVKGVIDYYSDVITYAGGDAFAKLIAKYSNQPVYKYLFTYEGSRNFAKLLFGVNARGASHVDDVFYFFKPAGIPLLLSSEDRLFIDRVTTMMTNFMKYGDPTPTKTSLLPLRWPASSNVSLRLDHQLSLVGCCNRGDVLLGLMCRYGLPGFVPCESAAMCNR